MEENNTVERNEEKKEVKVKKPDPNNKTFSQAINEWWKGCLGEFRKIVWPSRPELAKKTFTVIVVSLFIGAIIVAMDSVYNTGITTIIGLISK